MPNVQLRPYQIEGIRKIFEAWDPKRLNLMNVLFQMPTGTGKTTVFSEIVRKAHVKQKKILIVVHRTELVEQIVERLALFDVEAGIISANLKANSSLDVQVATIQTLSRRSNPPADILIIDECHHAKAATYKKLWNIYPQSRFLGVTATPVRINGEGFSDLFDILISLGTLSNFIEQGYLAPIKHLVSGTPDLSRVKKKMRDYDIKMLRNVMLDNALMANLVESYQKFIPGKKTIIFAVDIQHSKEIISRYQAAGIPAVHLDAKTPKAERKDILSKFRSGEYLVLSNVNIVSEGFDVPDCEAVQLARPTKSLVLYLQQVGRCMRPSPDKEFGYVLDNAGLWLDHGLSYIDRDWTLEGKKKSNKKPKLFKPQAVIRDNDGFLREITQIEEAEGLELIELTGELERLLVFESFVNLAVSRDYKPVSAVFKYKEYLINNQFEMTEKEGQYCAKRMAKAGFEPRKGFWYYAKKDVNDSIRQNKKV